MEPETSTTKIVCPGSFGHWAAHRYMRFSISRVYFEACFAARTKSIGSNMDGRMVVLHAAAMAVADTPTSSMFLRFFRNARAPSLSSARSRSQTAFFSSEDFAADSPTSQVSGVSSLSSMSLFQSPAWASSFGVAWTRKRTSLSLTALPSRFHLASWYSSNLVNAVARPFLTWRGRVLLVSFWRSPFGQNMAMNSPSSSGRLTTRARVWATYGMCDLCRAISRQRSRGMWRSFWSKRASIAIWEMVGPSTCGTSSLIRSTTDTPSRYAMSSQSRQAMVSLRSSWVRVWAAAMLPAPPARRSSLL